MKTPSATLLFALIARACFASSPVIWINSTAAEPWKTMPSPAWEQGNPETPPNVRVAVSKTYQTIEGFGGCFNELGWVALGKASEDDRGKVISALFGDNGCAFTLARLPIGASDFATDAYSLDDTPGDLQLKAFSIERDRKQLLPFVKAAMAVRPALRCWGSPWSPPAWMKTNDNYSKGAIKPEPAILGAYARYFARWIESYRAEGINIYSVVPQNEPNIASPYPSCVWSASLLREFIAEYLGPTLRDRKMNVELWLQMNGDPFNQGENANYRLIGVMEDPQASAFVTGIGFQYDSKNQINAARELYPEKKLIRTETECRSGNNSWADAQSLYALMKQNFDSGANAYFLWNMVLDDTGMGPWKWRQNAPITVNHETGAVTYNGEYYAMRHFSQFVKPGARRVLTTGPLDDKIAFRNADGSIVIVLSNSSKKSQNAILNVAGKSEGNILKATLPPESFNTFVLAP